MPVIIKELEHINDWLMYTILTLLFISSFSFASGKPHMFLKYEKGIDDRGKYQLEYPSLSNIPNQKQINQHLQIRGVRDFMCGPDKHSKNHMHITTTIENVVLTSKLFSYAIQYEGYCGGPYPDAGAVWLIIDLLRNKKLNVMKEAENPKAFKQLIIDKFIQSKPTSYYEDCNHLITHDDLEHASFDYLLNQKGLTVKQSYAHVARACEYDIKLSCSTMKNYLKKDSALKAFCLHH